MLLVSSDSVVQSVDRSAIDAHAQEVVLSAFRTAAPSKLDPQAPFNAALESYCNAYPHISRPLARHVIAYILATAGWVR